MKIEEAKDAKAKELRPFIRARDTPKPASIVLYGIQQVMVCVSALLTVPILLSDAVCPGVHTGVLRNELISATFFSSGISTIIQTAFGMRLALLQGTAFAYIPTVQKFMQNKYQCNSTSNHEWTATNESVYMERMAMVQSSLLLSSIVPMLIGFSGLVGLFTKFVGPMTVSPLMLLLAFSQVGTMMTRMSQHWISVIQVISLVTTILYLADLKVPLPGIKNLKFHWYRVNIFGQYPYLIAILFTWAVCGLLTVFDIIPPESAARVDRNVSVKVINNAQWIGAPIPFRYGGLQIDATLFMGFLLSALTSVLESVGDYQTAARMSNERPPPTHAVNRGILAEGMGSFISGIFGPGVGMTTHTENIGVIGVTRVASRVTMLMAGVLLILLGLCTKIGAVLSTIPDALVGAILCSSMAMVVGVAVTNLQSVDMNLPRNMGIFGFSMMLGLIIPAYFEKHPLQTGWESFDDFMKVLLELQMFVGALIACFLDNTVGGATRSQRGLRERGEVLSFDMSEDTYAYPPFIMNVLDKVPFLQYLPCIPKQKRHSNKIQVMNNDDTRL